MLLGDGDGDRPASKSGEGSRERDLEKDRRCKAENSSELSTYLSNWQIGGGGKEVEDEAQPTHSKATLSERTEERSSKHGNLKRVVIENRKPR